MAVGSGPIKQSSSVVPVPFKPNRLLYENVILRDYQYGITRVYAAY